MLSIRPIIKVTDQGQAVVNERIFSFSRTMERLVDHLGEYVHSRKNPRVYLLYTGRRRELFNQFEYMVATQLGLKNLPTYPITPVVSAHSGPNCVGFGVFWD